MVVEIGRQCGRSDVEWNFCNYTAVQCDKRPTETFTGDKEGSKPREENLRKQTQNKNGSSDFQTLIFIFSLFHGFK